ncbi:MAG TPA: hypothetical protein PK812_07925 [Beijerinckiaceae bacterium]|nr:hypothetical protein [Beijerinckiaceae bacterium]
MVVSQCVRAAALAALVVAGGPAFAQMDTLTSVFRVIGIAPDDKEPIEYRERPPLVVPPSVGRLRAPEEPVAERNANWPQDPDVLARKRKAEDAKQPVAKDRSYDPSYGAQVPLNEAQRRNRYAGVPTTYQDTINRNQNDRNNLYLSPAEVGRVQAAARAQQPTLRPGEEPTRQYLTEPPKGYRRAASGAPVKATIDPIQNSDAVELDVLKSQRR